MLKKILITLFIVPVIGAAIYGYFHFKQIKTPLSPVIQAIPSNAAVILKCNTPKISLKNFSLENPVWKTLITYPFFTEIHTDIRMLDALFANGSDALNTIQDKPLFISAHPDASNHYGLLYLINLPNTLTKKQVNDFIKHAASKTASYNLRIYDGVALNELKLEENKTLFYFFNKGIFACTFSQFLMEDAIRQLNSGIPVSADAAFDKVWNSAGKKVEATLFINYTYFSQTLTNLVESKSSKILKPLSTFANWTSLDIKTKYNSYQLNGFTFSKDTSNNYLNIFAGQEPQEIEIAEQIPASTAYFQCYALSDINRYFKNYDTYLNNLTDHYTRQEQVNNLNKKYTVNAQNFFKQWIGNQFAYVITEPEGDNYEQNCYALFKTNGNKEVAQILSDFRLKINTKQLFTDTLSEKFRGYEIQHLNAESLVPLVFGESFEKIRTTHFVLIADAVIFANSSAALKKWINGVLAKHTLQEDPDYKLFAENIASQSNIYIYSALARSSRLFQNNFKKEVVNWTEPKTETLKNFHALAIQLSANQNMFYSTVFGEYKPCYKKAPETITETELDTTIHNTPSLITDPADSSKKIFVQDDAHKIYLIDNTGKILWKREMKEKIMSEVQSLRLSKDKGFQILFSTKTKIYLLDEEGGNVGKFPVVLKYIATNGVQAVDYDNTGDYRFLIAEENKRIYNYSHKGEPVNGWEAVVNSDKVNAPISYFRAKGMDYLVVLDQSGNVNVLERKGKSIVKFKQKLRNAYRNTYYLDSAPTLNASSIVACDSTGQITRLYFSGKLDKSQPLKTNREFYFSYVAENKNYVFTSKNKIEVYDEAKNKIAETKLELNTLFKPCILLNSAGGYQISISDTGKSLLLFSRNGKQLSGLETPATTAPEAGHFFGDTSWYVLLGAGKKVVVFPAY